MGLSLLHATGVSNQTLHAVLGSRRFSHLDLLTFFFCTPEALPVRRDTLDRVLGLLDGLIDGLIDILIHSILRFAFGAFGGSTHEAIEIPLSLYLSSTEQHQRDNAADDTCRHK